MNEQSMKRLDWIQRCWPSYKVIQKRALVSGKVTVAAECSKSDGGHKQSHIVQAGEDVSAIEDAIVDVAFQQLAREMMQPDLAHPSPAFIRMNGRG